MILINGDSWGCGELDNGCFVHPGIEFYLREHGLKIINLSQAGSSHLDITTRLRLFFNSGIVQALKYPIDIVFVFQTQWFRDLRPNMAYDFKLDEWNKEMPNIFVSSWYYDLSRIAQDNNVRIGIIGGCADTIWIDKFEQEYPGVFIACQSLTQLLTNQQDRISNPNYWGIGNRELIQKIKKFCRTEQDLEHLSHIMDMCRERNLIWKNNPQYFFPNGTHPNRHGHWMLFEFMKSHNFFLNHGGPK